MDRNPTGIPQEAAMAELEGRSRELLEDKNFANVGVIRPDGTPHVVPVWVDVEDGSVTLNSAEGRLWPELARRDPRVTITVQNHENPYEYVTIRGHVDDVTHEGADEHIDALAHKYLGEDKYPFRRPGEQRVKLRITPEAVHHSGG
jgi:PPOX class probable F420-dependent enzyme